MRAFPPVISSQLSCTHSGSLSAGQVSTLNPFPEPADQVRIPADALQRPCPCLYLRTSGKPIGYSQGIGSFIADTLEARGANVAG